MQQSILSGPSSYKNWKMHEQDCDLNCILEFPLYTDAKITNEIANDLGPYAIINTFTQGEAGVVQPRLILRAKVYRYYDVPTSCETDDSNYHGGGIEDEIAALISLFMGIRVKAGDVSRIFSSYDDPLGRPYAPSHLKNIPPLMLDKRRLKIPAAIGCHALNLDLLKILPTLQSDQAVALIRAARLYQNALWLSESEPALSWVMFVSALEAGANSWYQDQDSPIFLLKKCKREMYDKLTSSCSEDVTDFVAERIAPTLRATSKFIKFVIKFLPPQPATSLPKCYRITWSKNKMQRYLSKIYDYRSVSLHQGLPFPEPMCRHPDEIDGSFFEKPGGLAQHSLGSTWKCDDLPMYLHVFEYITRNVLINWMHSLKS
ncbi:hypothetical protein [Methylocucumis oryzae]|uniref:Apea-like HEPN domain-containing protein n=1 Tax=Methylocucumis oryzae TaxID=1632867 RepID=A0A0F3IIE9_9GAMM|nr:hypothetical protein [Methylocucumis oryzae]KJV06526.1 hypothetical protein VZ94_10620 [Methylocucumis oryzae]